MRYIRGSRKVSDAQRDAIVRAYLTEGYDAAKALALAADVSLRYIAKLLRNRGIPNTTRRGLKPGTGFNHHHLHPRWAVAIARGSVVA